MKDEEGKGGSCEKESVVYCIDCKRCKEEEGKIAEYWGETARTAFLRGEEHIKGLKEKKEDNSLWKHSALFHEGTLQERELRMRMMESHKSPLKRQVQEGVQLQVHTADIIMNSKSEWNHDRLPRIVIETGEEQQEDQENGMSEVRRGATSQVTKRARELGLVTDKTTKRKVAIDKEQKSIERKSKRVRQLEPEERIEVTGSKGIGKVDKSVIGKVLRGGGADNDRVKE